MAAAPENPQNTPEAAADLGEDVEARHPHAVPNESAAGTTGDTPVAGVPADAEAGPAGQRAEQAAAFLRAAFTPASGLYTDRLPSIAETVRRAKAGAHVAEAGPLHKASTAYGYLAAAIKAVAITVMWLVEHPARLLTVLLLVALLAGLVLAL